MSSEPSIEDHVAFKKLLDKQDPVAVEVHASFSSSRDHKAFSAGVIRAVRGESVSKIEKNKNNAVKQSNNASTSADAKNTAAAKNVCRHMLSTGKCRSGSSCKFSHDVSAQVGSVEPKAAKTTSNMSEKGNNTKLTEKKKQAPSTPSRAKVQPVASTAAAVDGASVSTPPRDTEEKKAATSRFLGLFGVRSSASHPATEDAPLMPPTDVPGHPLPKPDPPTQALLPSTDAPTVQESTVPSVADVQSTPQRERTRESGLESLLFDSPPNLKQFAHDVNNNTPNPGQNLDVPLDLSLGVSNLNLSNNGPPGFSPAGAPPGFGGAQFPFPQGPENGHHFPPPNLGGPHSGAPFASPFDYMPPLPNSFPPHPMHPGGAGLYPPVPMPGIPMPGMPMPHMPPMPHMHGPGPFGNYPTGLGFGPPPPPMHQMQQPQYGQHGQMYQTMTAAPVRSTLSDFTPPPGNNNSHLSVHDMLGNSNASGEAPLSPLSDERAKRLLSLLNGGGAPLPCGAPPASTESGAGTASTETSPFSKSLNAPASSAVGGQQQKSRALLSLLKSSKAGPTLALNGSAAPPTPTSTNSSAASRSVPASPAAAPTRTPAAASAPPSVPAFSAPSVPVPAANFSTPVKGKGGRSQSITSDVGDEAEHGGAAAPATPARKASFFRNTKFQCGSMTITVNNVSRLNHVMQPSTNMCVHWQMPQEDFHTLMNKTSTALVIGLVRYGSYTNSPCFVSKQIERRPKLVRDEEGQAIYVGHVVFHAPKSAGQFVYRMFDESSKDSALTTLATSPMFTVDLADFYVNTNLRHILEALSEKSKVKGISQMPAVIRGIRNGGRNDRASGSSEQMMTECFQIVLKAIIDAIPAIEMWKERRRAAALEEKETGKESALATGKEAEEGKAGFKQAMRVQGESFEAISAVLECRAPYSLLSEHMRDVVARQQSLWCPHLQRYFRDAEHMQQYRIEEIGFNVALDGTHFRAADGDVVREAVGRINASIEQLLPKLLPRADFQVTRENAVAQLQRALLTENAVPPGTEVALYGSSNNSFGSDGADMDMTLIFPPGVNLTPEDKPIVIERLGEVLTRIGMSSVTTRATARIPIVQFKDPLNNFDCDISLQNQLAVANTKLLRTYGSIDPRVRNLVFLIKHWAKNRHLNSPSDGTLSSYGFILLLIHFLQNRPIPLVPNLQKLPPVWNGVRLTPAQWHLDMRGVSPSSQDPTQRASLAQYQQRLAMDQEQQDLLSRFERQSISKVRVQSADNIRCNAYFYAPVLAQPHLLPNYARENEESMAGLLVEFFRYYAWTFDFRHDVVSIRHSGKLSKLDKAEQHGWLQSDILSIEDPFETHYDVAHVIKSAQMVYLRKEMLRAYTLASRVLNPNPVADSLPSTVAPEDLLSLLCAPAELPAFTRERHASIDLTAADK